MNVAVVWRLDQWMAVAVMGLRVWLAPQADMGRQRGFSEAKKPQGSAKEGTILSVKKEGRVS
ncbi:hypothetical protein JOQ06_016823, partial [Pogonophryne albipinna]